MFSTKAPLLLITKSGYIHLPSKDAQDCFNENSNNTIMVRVHWRSNQIYLSLHSKHFHTSLLRKLGQQQQKRNGTGGGGKRRKRSPTNPTILKNYVRPRTQLLIGGVLVVLIKQRSIHQSNQVCFVYECRRSGLIWFAVADYKCFRLICIWIVFVQRCIRSESLQSTTGDRAVEISEGQFIGNDGVPIWLEKMDCLLEITST